MNSDLQMRDDNVNILFTVIYSSEDSSLTNMFPIADVVQKNNLLLLKIIRLYKESARM